MHRIITSVMLSAVLVGTAAWAQDDYGTSATNDQSTAGQAGQTGDVSGVTTTTAEEVTRGMLRDEVVGIKPQVGIMAYTDAANNSTSRIAEGLTLEWNATGSIASMMGTEGGLKNWYIGPVTGLVYSHLGAPSSNFFGTSPNSGVSGGGANFFFVPVNLKIGYNMGEKFRLAAHGGGNVTYRSEANSLNLGSTSSSGTLSVWRMYPNIGGDIEYSIGRNVALIARPDVTLTPGNSLFVGTLGISAALG